MLDHGGRGVLEMVFKMEVLVAFGIGFAFLILDMTLGVVDDFLEGWEES